DLCPVAGVGLIRACVGNENGTSNLVLQGLARVRLLGSTQDQPFRVARVELVKSIVGSPIEADALSVKVVEFCARIEELGVPLPPNVMGHLRQIESSEILSNDVSAVFVTEPSQRQQLSAGYEVNPLSSSPSQFVRPQRG